MTAGVRTANMRACLRGLEAAGLPSEALARAAGIEVEALDDPERWIPARAMFDLWSAAAARDPSPDLGLRVGERVPPGALDVFDYLLPACATLGDAFSQMARLHPAATTTSRFRVVEGADEVRVESALQVPGAAIHPLCRDYVFTLLASRLRRIDARMRPSRVELRGAAVASPARYAEALGAPVSFGHASGALVFERAVWGLPMAGADAALREILARHGTHLAARAPAADLVDVARRELSVMIAEGRAEVALLARRLGLSPRTLQRRLEARGVAYSALLDGARRDLALAWLGDPNLRVDEVAGLLGYSEPSAFARAFRRWTGTSPARHRRASGRAG